MDTSLCERPVTGLGALLLFYYTRARDRSPCTQIHRSPARLTERTASRALSPRVDVRSCRSLAERRHAHLCLRVSSGSRTSRRKHRESLLSQSRPIPYVLSADGVVLQLERFVLGEDDAACDSALRLSRAFFLR